MDIDPKLVDAGKQCPCCGTKAAAQSAVALGIGLFICRSCGESWIDVSKEIAA